MLAILLIVKEQKKVRGIFSLAIVFFKSLVVSNN